MTMVPAKRTIPKPLVERTYINDRGYVHYRRRSEEDRMVVPHNCHQLLLAESHFNVEVFCTVNLIMYLYTSTSSRGVTEQGESLSILFVHQHNVHATRKSPKIMCYYYVMYAIIKYCNSVQYCTCMLQSCILCATCRPVA